MAKQKRSPVPIRPKHKFTIAASSIKTQCCGLPVPLAAGTMGLFICPLDVAPEDGLTPTIPSPLETPPVRTGVSKTGEDVPCAQVRELVMWGGGSGGWVEAKEEEPLSRE